MSFGQQLHPLDVRERPNGLRKFIYGRRLGRSLVAPQVCCCLKVFSLFFSRFLCEAFSVIHQSDPRWNRNWS